VEEEGILENKLGFEEIINNKQIKTVFQPIISLIDAKIVGYEALTRGPENSEFKDALSLFDEAKKRNKLWLLEKISRERSISKAKEMLSRKKEMLFINVDPDIFTMNDFEMGFTKKLISKLGIDSSQICFEITERTAIYDLNKFKKTIDNYKNQGYKIAIDDAGSGYSGLERIAEVRPHFIKLDIALIRNIHKDPFKQALIKSFVNLSLNTNTKIIAEGIESKEELKMLIKLGVNYGQGFYMVRPSEYFVKTENSLKSFILNENRNQEKILSFTDTYNCIGTLINKKRTFLESSTCREIFDYMRAENHESVCIVKKDKPVGLVMQNQILIHFAHKFGNALYTKRPIALIMDTAFLIVDFYETVIEVSKKAMNRTNEKTYDSIVVTKNGKYEGIISIKNLLNYITNLEKKYARELNPLSNLPGNIIINRVLKDIIYKQKIYCVLYFDLDNFKNYNDYYGFENGDKILKYTADLINNQTKKVFPFDSFVGHIGGDDFLCVVQGDYDNCLFLCKNIIDNFDKEILKYYGDDNKKIPKTGMSIAGYYGEFGDFKNPEMLGNIMSEIKKQVKKVSGSTYKIERKISLINREEVYNEN